MQVALITNAYVPLARVTPVDNVEICPLSVLAQPLELAGKLPEIAPVAETVPLVVLVDPEIDALVPVNAPLATANDMVPVWLGPLDVPPLQVPE